MSFDSPVLTDANSVMAQVLAEDDLAQFVFQRFQEAKAARRPYDAHWEKWYRRYAGQHWDTPRAQWRSSPVVNFIFSTVETIVPIMTDHAPQVTVVPVKPENAAIADVHAQIQNRVWVDNDMDLQLPQIVQNSLVYGTGIAKVWWNPRLKNGQGDVAISVVDPRHFFVSPGATSLKDANYCVFAANVPLETIYSLYPEAKGKVTPGIWEEDLTVEKSITSQGTSPMQMMGPIQNTNGGASQWPSQGGAPAQVADRKTLATLVECWYRDESGRAVCVIMANGTRLKGPVSPYDHNDYPFVRFVDYTVPACFWGMGEVQQLESLQDNINRRRGQMTDILKLTASPPLIADSDSGINPKALLTRPGIVIFKNRGTDVRWLTPPAIPSALFELQALDKQDFDSISGVLDVMQGRKPTGIEAAAAISELQEAAQSRIRLKVRNMEGSLRQLGRLVLGCVQQFYRTERTVRLVGQRPNHPQFVTVNQQAVDPATNVAQLVNDVSVGEYDIEIGVGSTMPVNKTRRFSQMLQMFKDGIVDAQAVLENAGLSPEEVDRILQRVEAKEQELLAMQTGAQVAPGPEPTSQMPAEADLQALEEEAASTQLGEE